MSSDKGSLSRLLAASTKVQGTLLIYRKSASYLGQVTTIVLYLMHFL